MTPRRRRFRVFDDSELVFLQHALGTMPTNEQIAGMVEELTDEIAMRDRFRSCAVHDMEPQIVGTGRNMFTCRKCGAPGWTQEDFDNAMSYGY